MHRYWFFPLTLAVLAGVTPWLCYWEGRAPFLVAIVALYQMDFSVLWLMLQTALDPSQLIYPFPGAALGAIVGLGAAIYAQVRQSNTDSSGWKSIWRLSGNFVWCGFYALVFIGLTDVFYSLFLLFTFHSPYRLLRFNTLVGAFPLLVATLANVTALLWGLRHTLNATNVLTPRLLLAKARRATHLKVT